MRGKKKKKQKGTPFSNERSEACDSTEQET